MLRNLFLLSGLLAATTLVSSGCRSCASCHDYDPPVANCDCCAYGTHRAGSVSSGYVGGYIEEHYYDYDAAQPDARPEPEVAIRLGRSATLRP